ncbi:MAG: ligase-associated DNA damage response exonuclease [Rubripirellula sp.]|nr:DNA ligase-associated DEXH box helicase [Rhodopirellula sp.]MCH1438529.1 ligase-associated DNA damage response exonuclease [Rubripirellula sp.]OUX05951.1 MAG: DNA ligase-associated DEXH box helicase [Planctomycetaceae bacterium TMED240]
MSTLLQQTSRGFYCPQGDFYVDPHRPVGRAVITHAHTDHARWGSRLYLAARSSEHLLRMRMSPDAEFQFANYGETISIGGVKVSFHPAGHILGSAQVRLEYHGRIEVVTGDYKLGSDATCESWQPLRCHLLVTESTFGLPVYRWPEQNSVFDSINQWWRENQSQDQCSILYGYAVGKSQRIIAGLDPSIGPIFCHGAVEKGNEAYRQTGVALPPTIHTSNTEKSQRWAGAMIIAVPSAHGTPWIKRFGKISTAMASGWMAIRGSRRQRSFDRGFILSDHVDWPSLLESVDACDPETVWVTHGYSAVVARFLREGGRDAISLDRWQRPDTEEEDSRTDKNSEEKSE